MLDSMPVEAVLIDPEGKIVAVNAHWDRFARDNGYPEDSLGLGTNYLSVCLGSGIEAPVEGRVVAEGLHDVLNGRLEEFSTVYPCHSPSERRWFRLVAARAADGAGAVVLHFNITPEMLAEERLVGDRIAIERRLARIEAAMRETVRTDSGVLAGTAAKERTGRTDEASTVAAGQTGNGSGDPQMRVLLPRYRAMLHAALGSQIYRRQRSIRDDARRIAGDLADIDADAAFVARLHAEALTAMQAGTSPERASWVTHETRLAFIAVLGHLADRYRQSFRKPDPPRSTAPGS